jgi:PAS domain S-box-containing protein
MKPEHKQLIRQYLLVFLAAALATTLVIGYFFWQSRQQTERSVEANLLNTVSSIETRLDATLNRLNSDLMATIETLPPEALLEKNRERYATEITRRLETQIRLFPELNSYRIYAADGRDLYYTGSRGPRHTVADRSYFKCLKANPKTPFCYSEALIGKITKTPALVIAKAITDANGQMRGLVLASLDLDYFVKLFSSIDLGPLGTLVLRRTEDGALIARWPEKNETLNTPLKPGNPVRQLLENGAITGSMKVIAQVDNIERLYVFKRVADHPFAIFAGRAKIDYFSEWRQTLAIGSGVAALVLLVLGALMYRQMLGHQRELEAARNVEGALEYVHDAILVHQLDGTILRTNRKMHELFGVNADEVTHYQIIQDYSAREFDGALLAERWQAAAQGEDQSFEWKARRPKDGSTFDAGIYLTRFNYADTPAILATVSDITAQKEAAATMLKGQMAAEQANRAKSVFLANMSHELRTPLNAILGFAQVMERDSRIPADELKNLATINRSGQHLLALINDILEISRIEAGRLSVSLTVLDLPDLLDNVVDSMLLRAQAKNLVLRLEMAFDLPQHIESDISKLRQILLNLLSNAVKFSQQGEIVLAARVLTPGAESPIDHKQHAILEFSVRDSGLGISGRELERIFAPFYQTDAGIQQGEGTGLGLAISREYARLLGGELSAESKSGAGSTFRLRLPVTLASALPQAVAQGRVQRLSAGQPVYRVLVAEDEPVNQELLRMILADVGFEVRVAGDGRAAIDQFLTWQPHFIWMDMRMPVMDGMEATRAIRALAAGGRVPIVAFTASAFEEEKQEILDAGCDDVLTKPLEENRLFDLMERYLGVRFEREEPIATATGNLVSFAVLPAPTFHQLREAATALDAETIRGIAAELASTHADLSRQILDLVDSYRFDRLLELLDTAA